MKFLILLLALSVFAEPPNISGIYPHLTMRNSDGECGTGAVVPWQGSLWAITYAPHKPAGSDDKLYEITADLEQRIFPNSVGGTPANRMIHRETNQLLIGAYLIDAEKAIRVIPQSKMYGRLTGTARHLTQPTTHAYYATMEEGLYTVDLRNLAVTSHILDGHVKDGGLRSQLAGYHGKGLYTGQGRLVYSNNGEKGGRVRVDPTVPSGALAEWYGDGDWQLVRRNQFTEVTGPGGIYGSDPEAPLWAMGWDARSLILALLENKTWHYYRLPKGSHSYDGAHGWNTEWPRIREIGETDLLATMHGTFWRFPATFSRANSAGIAPRSNYLKVIGDFCRWGDRVVLGCDDSAKSEFLNTRSFKAKHGAAKQSNSNVWFIAPEQLDQLGPPIGRGSVWLREDVAANTPSDPYLFSGFDHRQLHLSHSGDSAISIRLEVDAAGNDNWTELTTLTIPASGAISHIFSAEQTGTWIRLIPRQSARAISANFQYRNRDTRDATNDATFGGLGGPITGVMRSQSYDRLGLVVDGAYYELDDTLQLQPVADSAAADELVKAVAQPASGISFDAASVVITEDGKTYRLPKSPGFDSESAGGPPAKTLEDYLRDSLAIGASVTVSSTHGDYAGGHIVDGAMDDESRWIATQADAAKSVTIDLGGQKTFRQVIVVTGWKHESQYAAKTFELVADGTVIASVNGNTQVERVITLDTPVTAQTLRLSSPDEGFLRLYEIALFPEPISLAQATPRARICREVATERDLLNLHGSFYELPARNAQGLAKIRPIATHNLQIHDFCSHAGLFLMTGIDADSASPHIIRSNDGKAAVWAGVVDELWTLGKPRGIGGPWHNTPVEADVPSDPYLMTAYDRKRVTLSANSATRIRLEVDIDGTGLWIPYQTFAISANVPFEHSFPEGFSAYWVRAVSTSATRATVRFQYE